ncbi:MAG TPA: hypothetical protein DIU00_07715 [Phycisphaerales bacterium]|nr:hypothetical protein [Phycisphaerales bacterium]
MKKQSQFLKGRNGCMYLHIKVIRNFRIVSDNEKTKPIKANFFKAHVTAAVSCFILPIWLQNPYL